MAPHGYSNHDSYQPSGKIGDLAWIYFMLVCAVILPLIGALYAIIIWYMPITFFNPLFTFLFANAIMVVHNLLVIEYGKVRDTLLLFQMMYDSLWQNLNN